MKKQITDATQFWEWIENIFLPAAFVDDWYNGHEERVSEYIGNKRSILVGMPRLRQLRVKESKYIIYKKEFILLEFVADILQSTYFTGFDYNHHARKFHFWKSDDETE